MNRLTPISWLKSKLLNGYTSTELYLAALVKDPERLNLGNWTKPSPVRLVKADIRAWQLAISSATTPDAPTMLPLYTIYDRILYDEQVQSAMDNRVLRVTQSRFRWIDKKKKVNEELTLQFEESWFYDWIKFAMESRFFGHSLIGVKAVDPNGNIKDVELVNRRHVKADKGIVVKQETDTDGQAYRTPPQSNYVFEIGDAKALGILCKVVPFALLKNPALHAWSIYTDKYSMPFRTVKTSNADTKRLDQLATMMSDMGMDLWAVLQGDEELQLISSSNENGWQNYDKFWSRLDQCIAKIILGNDATLSTKDNTGTYSSISAMAELQEYRHWDDKTFLKNLVNRFKEQFQMFGYKIGDHTFEWDEFEEMPVKDMIDAIPKISPYAELDWAAISEKTGIPILGPKKEVDADPLGK